MMLGMWRLGIELEEAAGSHYIFSRVGLEAKGEESGENLSGHGKSWGLSQGQ